VPRHRVGQGGLSTVIERPGVRRAPGQRRRRRRRPIAPRVWHFASFAAPSVLIYVCFVLAPILISFGYSLTNYNPFNPPTKYVGLHNYQLLFEDEQFTTALR